MNRRYVIAGVAVVALGGLWYYHSHSGSGGGGGTVAASSSSAQGATTTPVVSALPTSLLYGSTTATTPTAPSGTLGSMSAFGTPRDPFVQLVGTSSTPGGTSNLSFGSGTTATTTSTTSSTPISLGSGPTSGVPSGSSGSSGSGASSGVTSAGTTTPSNETLEADFDINGEPVVAYADDEIPPETQQFTVRSIAPLAVVLALNGALLPNGADTVTIKVGESLTLDDQTAGSTTVIRLLSVRAA